MQPNLVGAIAQLVEQWTENPCVPSSNLGSTTFKKNPCSQLIAGVYDPNIAGRYLEAGAQIERLGDINSGVFWLKKPRFLNSL